MILFGVKSCKPLIAVLSAIGLTLVSGGITNSATDNKYINDENRANAAKVGKEVQERMEAFRGGDETFYRDLLKALQISECDRTKTQGGSSAAVTRFVSPGSPLAYKNEQTGDCITVSEPSERTKKEYARGYCEVKPNCYWSNTLLKERLPVYSVTENPEAPQNAMTLVEAQKVLEEWLKGLVVFIAPGIVLSVLSFLTLVLFIFCRCCCNKCGGRRANPDGYSFFAKFSPFFFFVLFSVGIAATAGVALLYNGEVTVAVTGVFDVSKNLMVDTEKWILKARQPLVNVKNEVLDSVIGITNALEGTDFIEGGVETLTFKLDAFGENTANVKLPNGCQLNQAGEICVPCQVCTTISDEISKTNTQITSLASDGIEDFAKVRKTLQTKLVDIGDSIKSMVDDKVSQTDDMIDSIDKAELQLKNVRDQWDAQDQVRSVGVLGMFSIAVIVIVLAFIGMILRYTPFDFLKLMHLAYLLGFMGLIIVFIIASVLMAFGVLLSDSCAIAKIMSEDWTPVLGESSARGINACFQNESLLEAFNLTGSFDFAETLKFPKNVDVGSMFEFTELTEFSDSINDTGADTFDVSLLETYMSKLNEVTGLNVPTPINCTPNDTSYSLDYLHSPWMANEGSNPSNVTIENYIRKRYDVVNDACTGVVSPECSRGQNPCDYVEFVWEIYSNITALDGVSKDSAVFVDEMKTNMTDVVDFIDEFKVNVTSLDSSVTQIKVDLVDNLIGYVDDFKSEMKCAFVADSFMDMHNHMCAELMPALVMIAIMILLMGIFLIPVNICIIILAKRLNVKNKKPSYKTDFKV